MRYSVLDKFCPSGTGGLVKPSLVCDHQALLRYVKCQREKVMNRFAVYNFTVAVIVACFIWTPAFAQSEKISLRMVPQPNQVLRIRMVQETDADMSFRPNALP